MYFTVQLDFVTQIITNSSSVVYSYADDNAFKQFVNALFKEVGINKTCDDVFDLYVLPANLDAIIEDEKNEEYGELQNLLKEFSWREQAEIAESYILEKLKAGQKVDYGETWFGLPNATRLLVVLKDGQPTTFGNLVQRVFTHEAFRDG